MKSGASVLVCSILGSSMAFIDSNVVNVALPAMQSSLRATVNDMQWTVESYALLLAARQAACAAAHREEIARAGCKEEETHARKGENGASTGTRENA